MATHTHTHTHSQCKTVEAEDLCYPTATVAYRRRKMRQAETDKNGRTTTAVTDRSAKKKKQQELDLYTDK